jgi:hypothetical protein
MLFENCLDIKAWQLDECLFVFGIHLHHHIKAVEDILPVGSLPFRCWLESQYI